jgi:hypothetical protein
MQHEDNGSFMFENESISEGRRTLSPAPVG